MSKKNAKGCGKDYVSRRVTEGVRRGRLQFLRDTVGQVERDSMPGTLLAAEVRGTCRLGGFNALALSNVCFQCHRGAIDKKKEEKIMEEEGEKPSKMKRGASLPPTTGSLTP